MVSRRRALGLLGGAALLGAGCLGGPDRSRREGPSATPTLTPTPTGGPHTDGTDNPGTPPGTDSPPDGWPPPAWSPTWSLGVERVNVLDVDGAGDRTYVTASDEAAGDGDAGTTVVALDPGARDPRWRTDLPGEAVSGSTPGAGGEGWGVTRLPSTVLAVTGATAERAWTELSALEPDTGRVRWSLRRERRLEIVGEVDGRLYAVAREWEEPRTDEYTPASDTPTLEPLAATLLALDPADGTVRWSREFHGLRAADVGSEFVAIGVMNALLALGHDGGRQWSFGADHPARQVAVLEDTTLLLTEPDWDRTVVHGVDVDGRPAWTRRLPASRARVVDGDLFLGGDVLARLRPDGVYAWRVDDHASRLVFPPGKDRVYTRTGLNADAVGAYVAADGSHRWTFDPPISNAWPSAAGTDTVVAGGIGEPGQPLYRVDAADGTATARSSGLDPLGVGIHGEYALVGTGSYEGGGEVLALPL